MSAPTSWLWDHLVRSGYVSEGGSTRRARLKTCPAGCKSWVLTGLTGVICAVDARVDPEPLSELGEALALLEGRSTVALHHEGGQYVLNLRGHDDIRARPAGTAEREDVLRQHRCRTALPSGALVAATSFVKTEPAPVGDEPPF